MHVEPFEVVGSAGRPVRAVAHGDPQAPTVLVAHGFKGFKDWGMFPWMCDQLANEGLRAVRFDFSHNGVEQSDFDRLDLFVLDTLTRHQEDLRALVDATPGPLGLLGHSRGGGDCLLFAPTEPRVKAVATLASVARAPALSPDEEGALRARGVLLVRNARTGQDMPVGRPLFEDGAAHDIPGAAARLSCPLLLIHGDADEAVDPAAARTLARRAPDATALLVPEAGHTFGATHPFAGPTPALSRVMARLADWLGRHLLHGSATE